MQSIDCSVTLAIEPIVSDQRFVVTRTTFRLYRKSDILPSLLRETKMDVCLNYILAFLRFREKNIRPLWHILIVYRADLIKLL